MRCRDTQQEYKCSWIVTGYSLILAFMHVWGVIATMSVANNFISIIFTANVMFSTTTIIASSYLMLTSYVLLKYS